LSLKSTRFDRPANNAGPWRARVGCGETIAQRTGITRKTLHCVEQDDPAVALDVYARVLQALRLENDLAANAQTLSCYGFRV
jgi:hypothetical protein